MFGIFVTFAVVSTFFGVEGINVTRQKRQNPAEQNGQVIDNIFNIPITAIRQTAAAAQSLSPENTRNIDNVFQIPISTLEAVGNLVKATATQRRQNPGELQQMRQERRERILAQKERQRLQREKIQNERLRQQELKRIARHHHKDPFGLNALTNLLVGHHGLLGNHGVHIGQGLNGNNGGIFGGHGNHGGLGGHGGHGIHGILGSASNRPQNSYAVHENVDEGGLLSWHGLTAGIGSFHTSGANKIQNKVAPKDTDPIKYSYDDSQIQNKIAPASRDRNRSGYQDDPPLEHKAAARNDRITFH